MVGGQCNLVQQVPCSDLGDAQRATHGLVGVSLPPGSSTLTEWRSVNVHQSPPRNLVVDNLS
jgi:hypothetical protein